MKESSSILIPTLLVLMVAGAAPAAHAHCQIPCGIYDDELRLQLIAEHITTIEKSMRMIGELANAGERNDNQIVRWVMNKEDHATELQEIVTQYFMTQRLKPVVAGGDGREGYVRQLALLHEMLVEAMKAKQSTDEEHVVRLRELLDEFRVAYLGETGTGAGDHSH